MKTAKSLLSLLCALALAASLGAVPSLAKDTAGNEKIRVACVGDSITDGGGSSVTSDSSYPGQLALMLDQSKYEVYNCGKGGATAMKKPNVVPSYWDTDEYKLAKSCKPNIVIIMLGTNDIVNENWNDNATFETDLTALVQSFLDMESVTEVYLCTPPSAYDSGHPALLRDAAVPAVKRIATALSVPLVDVYTATQGHSDWYKDGIHPNDKGAVQFAAILYKEVFGKETGTLTITTEVGNTVSLGSQSVRAGATGKVTLTVGDGIKTVRIRNSSQFVDVAINCRAGKANEADCRGLLNCTDLASEATMYDVNGTVTKANDGDISTGWQHGDNDYTNCWLAVDFGEKKTFDTIEIEWDSGNRAKQDKYTVQTSSDGTSWTNASVTFAYTDAKDTITGSFNTRYLRIKISSGKDGKSCPSVLELRAYTASPVQAGALPGDVNTDGKVDAADLTALARHTGMIEYITDEQALSNADVDGVAGITANDLTALARHVGGIESL